MGSSSSTFVNKDFSPTQPEVYFPSFDSGKQRIATIPNPKAQLFASVYIDPIR